MNESNKDVSKAKRDAMCCMLARNGTGERERQRGAELNELKLGELEKKSSTKNMGCTWVEVESGLRLPPRET